jgi:PBP1b-binding outer membrane lipoprotein LpoB
MNKLIKFLSSSTAKNVVIIVAAIVAAFFFIRSCALSGDIRKADKEKEITEAVHNQTISELKGAMDSYSSSAAIAIVERDVAVGELKKLRDAGPIVHTVTITKEKPIDGELWVPKVDFNLANKCCNDNSIIITKQDEVIKRDAEVEKNLLGEIGSMEKIIVENGEYIKSLDSSYNKMKKLANRKIRFGFGGGIFAMYRDKKIELGPSVGVGFFKEI